MLNMLLACRLPITTANDVYSWKYVLFVAIVCRLVPQYITWHIHLSGESSPYTLCDVSYGATACTLAVVTHSCHARPHRDIHITFCLATVKHEARVLLRHCRIG